MNAGYSDLSALKTLEKGTFFSFKEGTEHEREVGLYSNSNMGKLEVVTWRKCGDE